MNLKDLKILSESVTRLILCSRWQPRLFSTPKVYYFPSEKIESNNFNRSPIIIDNLFEINNRKFL